MVAPGFLGVGLAKVPLRAASRPNGRDEVLWDEKGGSIRENGAETRRLFPRPAVLRLGDRPAGAVIGARGDDILVLKGVVRRDGIVGGGMDVNGVEVNVKGLNGFSETSLLLFFDGELKTAGSMFSLSISSKVEGSNGRLVCENSGLETEIFALPPDGDFCAKTPVLVSSHV